MEPRSWEEFINVMLTRLKAEQHICADSVTRITRGYLHGRLEQRASDGSIQRPAVLFPDLTARPWHKIEEYSWVQLLESNYHIIMNELNEVIANNGFKPHSEAPYLAETGSWNEYRFYSKGKKLEQNCARCPNTHALVTQVPGACVSGSVFFALASGSTHIVPHYGPHNLRIRGHFGLIIPSGCEMRVATETRSWQEGQMLLFDDSFEHEVWNRSNKDRVILIIDVWHPQLSPEEIQSFQFIDKELERLSSNYAKTGVLPSFEGKSNDY